MKDNRMDNIVECAYNIDNGYVEVWFYRWKYVVDKVRRSGGCSEDNGAVTGEAA